VTLNVHSFGDPDAPPLVLVHGLTEDGTCWPDAVARWRERWRVVAVDLRGHGESPRFDAGQLSRSPQVMQDDLADVLRAVGRACIVGHSLGGLLAARIAHDEPGLLLGAVLEDPAKPSGRWAPVPEFTEEILQFIETVSADPDGELARMRHETTWSEAELRSWASSKAKVDRRYVREGLYLGDGAWEEMFDEITVPTLAVVPVGGEMAPRSDRIRNPMVRIREVAGAGHCVRRDQPNAYHELVDPFLERLVEARSRGAGVP
jgi:pimeloyl-ACP methyl ester carboxylesterase